MMVFLGHALPTLPAGFGVTIFFLLSGYLITTLLRREFDTAGTVSLKKFYVRRVLRIWPPFYIVLAVTAVLASLGILSGKAAPAPLLAYSLHVANYWRIYHGLDDTPGGTSVYWSLAVEEHFYLVFPFLYIWMRRRGLSAQKQFALLLALCVAVLLWRVYLAAIPNLPQERYALATDTRVDGILAGCMLAVYGNPVLDKTRFSPNLWRFVWLPAAFAVLAVTYTVRTPVFHSAVKVTLQSFALMPFFVVAIRFPSWGPFRLLNTRPARLLGLVSYTLYLAHRPVLNFLDRHFELYWMPRLVIAFGVTLLICWGMYVLVEAPAARLRRQFSVTPREPSLGSLERTA